MFTICGSVYIFKKAGNFEKGVLKKELLIVLLNYFLFLNLSNQFDLKVLLILLFSIEI